MRPASRLALVGCRGASHTPVGRSAHPASIWRDWLTHADSLTARIKSRSTVFEVRVVFEGAVQLMSHERLLLKSPGPWRAREVVLFADGRPVVWARTVLPVRCLRGPWRFMGHLGTQPLGARLFSDPLMTRSEFVFLQSYRLPMRAKVLHGLHDGVGRARCARLERKAAPALLTEVLLPGIASL